MPIIPVSGKIEAEVINKNLSILDSKTMTMADLGQDVKEAMTGGSVPVVGKGSVNGYDNIKNGTVPLSNFTEEIQNRIANFEKQELEVKNGFLSYASSNVTSINNSAAYKTITSACNPGEVWNCDTTVEAETMSAVIFWKRDGTFLKDLNRGVVMTYDNYVFSTPPDCYYVSTTSRATGVVPALRKNIVVNTNILNQEIDTIKLGLVSFSELELEVKSGFLTYASSNVSAIGPNGLYRTIVAPCEQNQIMNCDVTVNDSTTSAVIFWKQDGTYLSDLDRGANKTFTNYKFTIPTNAYFVSVTSLSSGILPTLRIGESADIGNIDERVKVIESTSVRFKKTLIVNFGDSIYGNPKPPYDISTIIEKRLGATVINLGFGGCMMAKRAKGVVNGEEQTQYDAFSMYAISKAIATKDFSQQATALGAGNSLPAYFRASYNLLISIDWSKVDIVTIEYGTNDWSYAWGENHIPLDNDSDRLDFKSYAGATRYSIENLYVSNPSMKILLTSPTYRFWVDADLNFVEDSDTKDVRGKKLYEFCETMKKVAVEYKLPYFLNNSYF